VTEIVNQPFPSKVHALTGRVNRHSGSIKGKRWSDLAHKCQNKLLPATAWQFQSY
jgi:hypothetical protein